MLRDAIYGVAVADALGVPFEFKERGSFNCTGMSGQGTWNQEPGTWSDDTSLCLATCKSIKDKGGIDINDMRKNFRMWLFENKFTAAGETFDVGHTTKTALTSGQGLDDYYSNGNGSLMRIIPLAFLNVSDDDIKAVSAITHGHKISMEACVKYVHIAKKLLRGEEVLYDVKQPIKSGGFVEDTFNAAMYCIKTTTSYREAVLKAVNLGDDTDTTGAVTGGLAGIIYGYDAIPREWLEVLKNKELIEECLFKI